MPALANPDVMPLTNEFKLINDFILVAAFLLRNSAGALH